MPLWIALLAVVGLVAVTAVAGWAWRRGQDHARAVSAGSLDLADLELGERGRRATLVLFSTEYCSRCPQVRRTLDALAHDLDGVAHAEVDLTHRPHPPPRQHILQTPTVFVLDAAGAVHSRFGGAPHRQAVAAELHRLIGEPAHV